MVSGGLAGLVVLVLPRVVLLLVVLPRVVLPRVVLLLVLYHLPELYAALVRKHECITRSRAWPSHPAC